MSANVQDPQATLGRSDPQSWSADQKMRVVLEGLRGRRPVAQICREVGISTSRYYQWRDQFLQAGRRGFIRSELECQKLEERVQQLQVENAALHVEKEILQGAAIED